MEDEDGASGRGRRGRVQRFMDVVKDMERVGVTGGDGDERLSGLLKEGVMCVFVC